jgi:hypothetical protein
MMPAIVLSAFAAELFLKCLLLLDSETPPNTHDLKALFAGLSDQRKKRIEELWDKAVAANVKEFENTERQLGISLPRDLGSALSDCGNAFEGMRYLYEDPTKVKFYIVDFAPVLRATILEIKPEWEGVIGARSTARSPGQ